MISSFTGTLYKNDKKKSEWIASLYATFPFETSNGRINKEKNINILKEFALLPEVRSELEWLLSEWSGNASFKIECSIKE